MLLDPKPGGKNIDALLDGVSPSRRGRHGIGSTGISFDAVGRAVTRPVVEEGVQVRRVVIQPGTRAHNGVGVRPGRTNQCEG